jgi:hypothetical protein
MNTIQRKFSRQANLRAMAALVKDFPTDNVHVINLPYRLSSWALDDPGNIGLWFSSGNQRLAWAVLQIPFWTIDFPIHPEADQDLRRKLWDWTDQRAQALLDTPNGHPTLFEYSLPTGFSICPLAGVREIEAYVELHRAVFKSRNMTMEWRSRTLCQPEYIPWPGSGGSSPGGSPGGILRGLAHAR